MHTNSISENEKLVLETFQQEIPSIYFSDKSSKEYKEYNEKLETYYREALNFPKEMFSGKSLIDFGAGTGENTVSLANWGAKCTLVEMNIKSQKISKEIFSKYTNNINDHKFILSSIFEFDDPKLYNKFDIVHCRGVLSHTLDGKRAFEIISKYLKPGGYLIYGDPNRAGGFQNMLQRLIVYKFAKDKESMIQVCEDLFSDDIDRAQKFAKRTRNCIIFDRWVVECQDDPSVEEVLNWFKNNDLQFYNSYPKFSLPLSADSLHHSPKFDINNLGNHAHVLSELIWMTHVKDDVTFVPSMLNSLKPLGDDFDALTTMLKNVNPTKELDYKKTVEKIEKTKISLKELDLHKALNNEANKILEEVKDLLKILEKNNYENLKTYLNKCKFLFKGPVGMRHIDYISYKRPL